MTTRERCPPSMILQRTTFQLMQRLLSPTRNPMTNEQASLLFSNIPARYVCYTNYGLDHGLPCAETAESLVAARDSKDSTPRECLARAMEIELRACPALCGRTCAGRCKVIAFVLDSAGTARFFHGERQDVLLRAIPGVCLW